MFISCTLSIVLSYNKRTNMIAFFTVASHLTYREREIDHNRYLQKTPVMLQNITDINNSNVISVVTTVVLHC